MNNTIKNLYPARYVIIYNICFIFLLQTLKVSACLKSCGRSFHKVPPLYPKVLFQNSLLGFGRAKSVSLLRILFIPTFFLLNRSFKFGIEWSFNILYNKTDLFCNRLTLCVSQRSEFNKSADLAS